MNSTHRLISIACGVALVVAAGFLAFRHPGFLRAQEDDSKWKSFSEKRYGMSLEYPGNYSFNIGYDRYAKGLLSVDVVDKKCSGAAGQCDADCVDIRIFVGGRPNGDSNQLFIQLYEDMLGVKDTDNPELVQKTDIGGKTVYKILNEAPTLSLNGSCGGPLYIFDAGGGYFACVFAGYGADAGAAGEETVKKIISSVKVGGAE